MDSNSKSSTDEIRQRFDTDVDRFSNLETAQTSTVDAALAMNLACDAASLTTPQAHSLLDIGCGAGNYSLSLLKRLPNLSVTLLDLSAPMLARATQRIAQQSPGTSTTTLHGDIRTLDIGNSTHDIILAAASLHHLRTDDEYRNVFKKCFNALRPGGSFWIVDLVTHDIPAVQSLLWQRYGDYLTHFKNTEFRNAVFDCITAEDTPRSVPFQLDALRSAGFSTVDILHKNTCFATLAALKTTLTS